MIVKKMDKGDILAGGIMAGIGLGVVGAIVGIVYLVVLTAKAAWGTT